MAGLVFGAIGAYIGSFAGPTGAAYGWAIGSAIGGVVGQKAVHNEGPRVGDQQYTSSTLGTPMTVLYGTFRLAGNVIGASKMREVSTTQKQGKGGPKVTNTTYSYNMDIAVDLCNGPIGGIRKVWLDGKLAFDATAAPVGAPAPLLFGPQLFASGARAPAFKLYLGTESQLPDPTLEAIYGVGNVPAYRGRAYVVFSRLDCPSARVPQMTFEVFSSGKSATGKVAALFGFESIGAQTYQGLYYNPAFTLTRTVYPAAVGPDWTLEALGSTGNVAQYNTSGPGRPGLFGAMSGYLYTDGKASAEYSTLHAPLDASFAAAGDFTIEFVHDYNGQSLYQTASSGTCAAGDGIGANAGAAGTWKIANVYSASGRYYQFIYFGATGVSAGVSGGPASGRTRVAVCRDGNQLRMYYNGVLQASSAIPGAVGTLTASGLLTLGGLLSAAPNYDPIEQAAGIYDEFLFVNGAALYQGNYTPPTSQYPAVATLSVASFSPVSLADIILDQCGRAGIAAALVDVSALTDTVYGYGVTRVSSARAVLEQLAKAYFVDHVEIDGKLVFRKRAAQANVATIAFDELAAVENSATPGDPFPLARTQEADLPRSVKIQYINITSDYQQGAEIVARQTTHSLNDLADDVPVCLYPNQAKQIANGLLFDAWSGRNRRSGKLTRKYAHLTPGDVVTIEYPKGASQDRILIRVNDTGVLLDVEFIDANAAIYTAAPPGSDVSVPQTIELIPSASRFQLLDIPLLRDLDDNAGLYVAQAGIETPWYGAALYFGVDDATLVFHGDVDAAAPIGATENALGNFAGNTIDEANLLTVNVRPDTLISTTRDLVLNGTDNFCAVGAPGRWELLQFIRAASLGSGRYTLSGFKRGLRGTEAYKSTHTAADTFVLLTPAGLLRPLFDIADLGQARKFRSVSKGLSIDSVLSTTASNSGIGLRPLSPYNLRGARSAGDLALTWSRRTRLSDNWLAGLVPLGETSESYSIDIFIDNTFTTVKRTLTSAAPAITYTSAQQVADFGANQAAVYLRIYQLSSTIARGFALQGTI